MSFREINMLGRSFFIVFHALNTQTAFDFLAAKFLFTSEVLVKQEILDFRFEKKLSWNWFTWSHNHVIRNPIRWQWLWLQAIGDNDNTSNLSKIG